MSLGRVAGPVLATICGVCTAYATLGPELQKQAAEKNQFKTHSESTDAAVPAAPSTSAAPLGEQQRTVVSNEKTLGKEVKDVVQDTKAEIAAANPGSGWFGLGAWGSVFGGAESPKEKKKVEEEKKNDKEP